LPYGQFAYGEHGLRYAPKNTVSAHLSRKTVNLARPRISWVSENIALRI